MTVKTKDKPEVDPREREDWFIRLPEQAKQEFRERFRQEGRSPESELQRQGRMTQCLIDGSIVYLPTEFLFYGLSPGSALVSLAMGLALGMLWFRTDANRVLLTILGVIVVRTLCGFGGYLVFALYLGVTILISRATSLTREPGRRA
ncbi:MAG: hypothetical protein ACYTG5_09320 [Planctomycetota bacterium]